jgi:hypothetical protein
MQGLKVALSLNHSSNRLWLGFNLGKNSAHEEHDRVGLYPVSVNPRNPGRQVGSSEAPAAGGLRSREKREKIKGFRRKKSFFFFKSFYNLQTNLNSNQIWILTTSTHTIKYKSTSPHKEKYALAWNPTNNYLFKYINL